MEEQTKSGKFVKIAERRVNNCIKYLDMLEPLANRSNYDYSEEQINKIFETIQARVDNLKISFELSKPKQKESFSF